MDTVIVKQCVITTLTRRGKGVEGSPIRIITEVWDAVTGEKIAEHDPDWHYAYLHDVFHRKDYISEGTTRD